MGRAALLIGASSFSRDRGDKIVMWHGFADQLIVSGGMIDCYDVITQTLGGGYKRTQQFARLFIAPGVRREAGGRRAPGRE